MATDYGQIERQNREVTQTTQASQFKATCLSLLDGIASHGRLMW